ncbi:MAG TPA: toll/interleukin-1 receptor domain-containing protein, partial [Prolixibacteraceae bacterium]|nr:toll/interleukin-1 receptor domain-containing protein [Prolixibacteraceae bacterium]
MNIDELTQRAIKYVELEANTKVINAEFVERYSLLGRDDVVISVHTMDKDDPEWWVVGGDTPMNLYTKNKFRSADEAFSFHTGIMIRLMTRDFEASTIPPDGVGYDAFISHASEDKDSLVRPLARMLNKMGFYIWYDEFELKIGDSLRQSIDKGLVNSKYGIVVLSKSFFAKNWPQYELNGLTAKEIGGQKVILPIWHEVTKEDV